MRTTADAPVTIRRLSPPQDLRAELAADIRRGMAAHPKRIPSKHLYDAEGSRLFEEITRLPEYYPTRTETAILAQRAAEILIASRPDELIELGSGASDKTRHLLDAMLAHTGGRRYVPIDISAEALTQAVKVLCSDYPTLTIDGLISDYDTDLPQVPRHGRRLVTFLGSTIGNLTGPARVGFLTELAGMLPVRMSTSPPLPTPPPHSPTSDHDVQ